MDKYNMEIDNPKEKIKGGDVETAAAMVGITTTNAYKALKRVGSKHHESMQKALRTIIAKREELIEAGI